MDGADAGSLSPTPLLALWGKTDRETGGSGYHPLVCHLLDVGSVAERLWTVVLTERVRDRIARAWDLDASEAGNWFSLLAATHDLGKASPTFQVKAGDRHTARVQSAGLPLSSSDAVGGAAAHGDVSAAILTDLLPKTAGLSIHTAELIARLVGGHHAVPVSRSRLRRARRTGVLGGESWRVVQREILEALIAHWPVKVAPTAAPDGVAMRLAGMVCVADWIGSDVRHFPLAASTASMPALNVADYGVESRRRARAAVSAIAWRAPVLPEPADFRSLFCFDPRPTQELVGELLDDLSPPGLVVIEDGTGSGKTEAALLCVQRWLGAGAIRGAYMALPTRATSDQAHRRMRDFLSYALPGGTDIQLVHGTAALAVDREELAGHGTDVLPRGVHDGEGDRPSSVRPATWFRQRKRGLLGPFAVGTIDQALVGALQARHQFVRLWGLSDKAVVLDEVHAYDTYMSTLLDRLVEWLAACGASVVVLSATLPAGRRLALAAAYRRGLGRTDMGSLGEESAYPRVTVADANGVTSRESTPTRRRTIRLERWTTKPEAEPSSSTALFEALSQALAGGGCAAIVCNTVDRARKLYVALREALGDAEVTLLHSRMRHRERAALEGELLTRFGPPGPTVARPFRAVVVATQVIEQSLDLDFDLLISDLAPIDLLVQRAGRLHRHERPRPDGILSTPTMWLLWPEADEDGGPRLDGGSRAVYGEELLLRTWLVMRDCDAIYEPEDLDGLVGAVYGDALSSGVPALRERLIAAHGEAVRLQERHEHLAREVALATPAGADSFLERGSLRLDDDDQSEAHPTVRALTRLEDLPSVRVVILLPDECERDRLEAPVSFAAARRLLAHSVALSGWDVVRALSDEQVPVSWRESPLLRQHRLVACDSSGMAEIGKVRFTLDNELGVLVDPAR
jgi:CRISPR-associated endonuclease/helicase Cas3